MLRRFTLFAVLVAVTCTALALSAADQPARPAEKTGSIAGTVVDSISGDPVIGAAVTIIGSPIGDLTDVNGKFFLTTLQPGTVSLRISSLGFHTVEMLDVEIRGGMTATLRVEMSPTEAKLEKVITVTTRERKESAARPAAEEPEDEASKQNQSTQAPLDQVSGVQSNADNDIYIRGGRAGEITYTVDGTPIGDPLGGLGDAGKKLSVVSGATVGKTKGVVSNELYRRPSRQTYPQTPDDYYYPGGVQYDAMYFQNYGTNPFVDTRHDHLSTFAIDVDDASWTLTKSYLERGSQPPADAVRVEEFINRFDYNYEAPRRETFAIFMDGGLSPFGPEGSYLVSIGIKGREITRNERKPVNLVFVIDVSGSMSREDRLGLVKRSLTMLVDQLRPDDRIGIVIFGSKADILLHPTAVRDGHTIKKAINRLAPGGSTNAAHGLQLGYEMADRMFDRNRTNQIILCSDGVANTGTTDPNKLLRHIREYADRGITLMTVGFGMGNYNDVFMEKLGDKGDGQYAYVNDWAQARRLFVERLAGSLEVIAKDVKIQVDFNPNVVSGWRLLGYENRDVADRDFRNDAVDGGEIYAGHSVTALYEVTLRQKGRRTASDIGDVNIRFVDPRAGEVEEIAFPMRRDVAASRFADCAPELKMAAAAAEFAEILRGSYWARGSSLSDVRRLAIEAARSMDSEETDELIRMIDLASQLTEYHAERW